MAFKVSRALLASEITDEEINKNLRVKLYQNTTPVSTTLSRDFFADEKEGE